MTLKAEDTLGHGNCAFHAFILGLCREPVLNALEKDLARQGVNPNEEYKYFIKRAAEALEVAETWEAVRAKILALRQTNKVELQKKLAQVMRDIAIERARSDKSHLERTMEPLLSAFRDSVYNSVGIPTGKVRDDIYKYHNFILDKFADLTPTVISELGESHLGEFDVTEYAKLKALKEPDATDRSRLEGLEAILGVAMDKVERELINWWTGESDSPLPVKSGYDTFLDEMQKSGKWAGDLELAQDAAYFHVNLDVSRPDYVVPHHMHIDHGTLPTKSDKDDFVLSAAHASQLNVRGIVDRPEKDAADLQLLPISKEEAVEKLSAVKDAEEVLRQIDTLVADEDDSLKGMPIQDDSLTPSSVKQLVARNVISRGDVSEPYIFSDIKKSDAVARVADMENKDKILAVWDKSHHEAPVITLTNPYAAHWSNMLPEDAPELAAEPAVPTPASTLSDISKTLLKIQSGEMKPSEEHWEAFVSKTIKEEEVLAPTAEKTITYTISESTEVKPEVTTEVTIKMQIKLDEELAKRLQQEELSKGISKELQEKLDRELAEQLHQEEVAKFKKPF